MSLRALALALCVSACGAAPEAKPAPPPTLAAAPRPKPAPAPQINPEEEALTRAIQLMLQRVAAARKLPAKRAVAARVLDREAVIERIIEKSERDLPKGVLEAQGELLRALELVPRDYDFVAGIYELIEKNVAGLYDPDGAVMILLDDLSLPLVEQTLAHELVHALQDQHFDLDALIKYSAGDTDRVTAAHALAEGDATSAMLDITMGSAFRIDVNQMRMLLVASVAMSESGAETPRVLQGALVAPYVDGFAFVQAIRARDDWGGVDRAWKRLPKSTEQLLHIDKYEADEPAVHVPDPPFPDEGFRKDDADVLGEQGLRLTLEQWTIRDRAAAAAAGWGGDRYLVARKPTPDGTESAVAWHIRFDSAKEAAEAATEIRRALPKDCVERATLGPIAWQRRGDGIAITAGPYLRNRASELTSRSTCKAARAWTTRVLDTR
ncbi:MAG TPA: hypothetical protein VFB62_04940 [Polyangiaceae bacterium]|nr:hypothetical protein [Polyangiaceae bacterium]